MAHIIIILFKIIVILFISEPVRKIPIASIPVLASAPAISSFPSEVLIPPHPSAVDSYSTAQASLNSNENSPQQSFSNYPSQSYYNPQQPQSYPSPVLIPPPPPHSQTVWNESPQLSYAQIPQIRTVSSSKIPKESLPPNTLDLGQTIVSTTQRTNSAPSQSDVDVSRINLQISSNSGLIPQLSSNIQTSLDEDSRQSLPDYPLNAPSTQTVSSAQNPEESLPPNIINLGQTVVSTTQRTDSVPSHRGVEVARINLQNPSLYTHSRVIPQLSPNIQTSFDGDSRQSLAVHPLDAPSTQTQITISSPSNNLNLKQAVVPTTQSTNSVPSGSDLEVTNINDYQQLPQLSPNIQTSFSENSRIHSGNTAQQTFSSTPIPKESLPPNTIDLGQTVVTTTRITDGAASTGDIDVRRINLGQSYTHQNFAQSSVISQLSSSTIPPLGERNIVSSTSAPILSSSIQTSYLAEQTGIPSSSPNRQLFRKASDIGENSLSSISSSSNLIFTLNGLTGRVPSPDQSIITNQISSNSPLSSTEDIRNRISSTEAPRNNIASSPWINVDPDHILPSAVTQPLNGGNHGPISTILDTVLVQPTDPKNREVIEFGGKQLENVGNIVPVIRHPVLVAGGLSHIQHIPTASISQLTARNGLRGPYDRNGGQLSDGN